MSVPSYMLHAHFAPSCPRNHSQNSIDRLTLIEIPVCFGVAVLISFTRLLFFRQRQTKWSVPPGSFGAKVPESHFKDNQDNQGSPRRQYRVFALCRSSFGHCDMCQRRLCQAPSATGRLQGLVCRALLWVPRPDCKQACPLDM